MLDEVVRLPKRSPQHDELVRALRAAAQLHVVVTDLEPVPVRVTATTSESGAYRFRNAEPVDIRVSRIGRPISLGFLHELAHLVDHQLGWASETHTAFARWRARVDRLERREIESARRRRYFHSPREFWARTYAQTALMRSGDELLLRRLAALQSVDDEHVWPSDTFMPVALEVERTLERLGLTAFPLPLAA